MDRRTLLVALPLATVVAGAIALAVARPDIPAGHGTLAADGSAEADSPLELTWEDLAPEGFVAPEDPFLSMPAERLAKLFDGSPESERELAEIDARMRHAPTVDALDGRLVRLAGYVVPLDFDGQTRLEEFLLVPWFGACVHTPPPPANQIVMADLAEPVELEDSYAPVTLTGVLHAEKVESTLAETAYRMDVRSVDVYAPPRGS